LLSGDGRHRAWVLVDDGDVRRFGAALVWAWGREVDRLDVLVEERVPGAAGVIARRAAELARPPGVWAVTGAALAAAVPAGDVPEAPLDDVQQAYAALIRGHGAEPVLEHGVLRGEVLGLEVARMVGDQLEVGVGRHDRAARLDMRPGEDLGAALDEAVAVVASMRRPGAARHPANTLARARWLRSVVCARPDLAGARELTPAAPPLPWFDLPEAAAAPAHGIDEDGEAVVAVCSTGIDTDLVPTAADSRRLRDPAARLVLVVPESDVHPATRHLAGALARPAEIRTVTRDWEAAWPER
jgi:hypothetical protein